MEMTELSDEVDYLLKCVDWDIKHDISKYPVSLVKYMLLGIRRELMKMEELNGDVE